MSLDRFTADGSKFKLPLPSIGAKEEMTMDSLSKEEEDEKSKRKKTRVACIYCQRSHSTCDDGRPCQRCIKRGIGHLCKDGMRKKSKYLSDENEDKEKVKEKKKKNKETQAKEEKTLTKNQEPDTKPYAYAQGFHLMFEYLKSRMNKDELLRICKAILTFRPTFMTVIKNLTQQDMALTERCFVRSILEFSKLLSNVPTPTCIWRRTGELVYISGEFLTLSGWPSESISGKRTFIFEMMDNQSVVEYWEKYSMMCKMSKQTVITQCVLWTPDKELIPCMVCYTIKRDIFDVPLCVLGNFLPIF